MQGTESDDNERKKDEMRHDWMDDTVRDKRIGHSESGTIFGKTDRWDNERDNDD